MTEFQLCGEINCGKREYLESIEDISHLVVVEKFNGYREMWKIGAGKNELINRSGASHLHTVPQFQVDIPELYGTVLDCEGMSPEGNHSKYAKRIFGSGADHAIEVQRHVGNAYLMAFDVLFFKGRDIRSLAWRDRRSFLMEAVDTARKFGIMDIEIESLVFRNKLQFFDKVVEDGGEGIIVKDVTSPYLPDRVSWTKIKKEITRDYFILGFTPGNGKYSDAIGAVVYGIRNSDDSFTELGRASGMTDEVRYHMADNQEFYIGKLAEFGGKDINPETGTLGHPKYIRLRDDV